MKSRIHSPGSSPHTHLSDALMLVMLLLSCILNGCTSKESGPGHSAAADTSISVYGPYTAIKLPIEKGVKIANPIQLAQGPRGVLYAANQTGEVYSLRDTDGDGLEDTAMLYADVKEQGLRSPNGFAFRGDTIYIGTAQQVRAYLDTNQDGRADTSWVFFNDIPYSEHPYEWTCGLTFGPDGWLYLALTTDSWNAAPSPDPRGYRGSILRISPNGQQVEQVATGIRSVYGMSFDPSGNLYFTDNEGGGNPQEELNLLVKNRFYGHNPAKYSADTATGPVLALTTELAPAGIEFNRPENDFGGTAGDLFIAFYGPGERWTRGGVGRVSIRQQADGSYAYQEFPVADIPKLSNLAFGTDGALYLAQHGRADYWYNAIYENEGAFYKLVWDPSVSPRLHTARAGLEKTFSKNAIEAGRQLYAEQACLGCHAVDGVTDLLGPNLKDIGKRMSREEILEEILYPSQRIKPSMMALRIIKKDSTVLMGRVVSASEDYISLMLIGNQVIDIPRREIARSEDEPKSMMYEGLLSRLSDQQKDALLDYLQSLRD
jgi:putative heme-binding domain-containing protein